MEKALFFSGLLGFLVVILPVVIFFIVFEVLTWNPFNNGII